ncbi:hypothetical protein JW865_07860 [Candidatus Bathyarchaeota archaeon]|nr:hypothetical protein [Candidatus Bathyarchaeota archaeon]
MDNYLIIWIRLLNSLITIAFFPYLYFIYKKTKKHFYLLWGGGFLLYGIGIIIRSILPTIGLEESLNAQIFSFIFTLSGFIFIIVGIGDLTNRIKLMLCTSMSIPLFLSYLFFTSKPYEIGRAISLIPFIFISISLLLIRKNYTSSLDLLTIGWIILTIDNIGLALELISEIFVEVFAVLGKIIIFLGMTYPRFSLLVDDFKRFLISGLPNNYTENNLKHVILVNSTNANREVELKWIKEQVEENKIHGIRTILISYHDLISINDIKNIRIDQKDLYIVRMLTGGRILQEIFTKDSMTINDDLNELDILLNEIIEFSKEKKIKCSVILYTLSSLIHIHGWKRVYSFMVSKFQYIKDSEIHVIAFYYPQTHENIADIVKFEKIVDDIIDL